MLTVTGPECIPNLMLGTPKREWEVLESVGEERDEMVTGTLLPANLKYPQLKAWCPTPRWSILHPYLSSAVSDVKENGEFVSLCQFTGN